MTVVAQKPPAEPYNVVLVDLDEHARLMSRVGGMCRPTRCAIGMRVKAKIGEQADEPLLLFEPV